jgi:hypothetical protein
MTENQTMLLSRRQRRAMLQQRGILKMISRIAFTGETCTRIRQQNRETGRKTHQAMLDQLEKSTTELFEQKVASMKSTWESIGYQGEELVQLEEAWMLLNIKTGENRREDVKRARSLMKNAQQSRINR